MRASSAEPARNEVRRWPVLGPLALAVTAMTALHGVQPELDPLADPVSFYVRGRHGWLLPVALGAFGVGLLALARALAGARAAWALRLLALAGALLLVTAVVPSDRWFPWEGPPSVSGLVHAAAAMLAPVLLAGALVAPAPPRHARGRGAQSLMVVLFLVALIGSAASLGLGLLRDGAPPLIGALERVLAFAAAAWMWVVAWRAHLPRAQGSPIAACGRG